MFEIIFVLMVSGEPRFVDSFNNLEQCQQKIKDLQYNTNEAVCIAKTIEEIQISNRGVDVRNYM